MYRGRPLKVLITRQTYENYITEEGVTFKPQLEENYSLVNVKLMPDVLNIGYVETVEVPCSAYALEHEDTFTVNQLTNLQYSTCSKIKLSRRYAVVAPDWQNHSNLVFRNNGEYTINALNYKGVVNGELISADYMSAVTIAVQVVPKLINWGYNNTFFNLNSYNEVVKFSDLPVSITSLFQGFQQFEINITAPYNPVYYTSPLHQPSSIFNSNGNYTVGDILRNINVDTTDYVSASNSIKFTVDVQPNLGSLIETLTNNDDYVFTASLNGYDGYDQVEITVDVPLLDNYIENINSNGNTVITTPNGYEGMKKVTVVTNVQPNLIPLTRTVTQNNTRYNYTTSLYDGFSEVHIDVNVPIKLTVDRVNIGFTDSTSVNLINNSIAWNYEKSISPIPSNDIIIPPNNVSVIYIPAVCVINGSNKALIGVLTLLS